MTIFMSTLFRRIYSNNMNLYDHAVNCVVNHIDVDLEPNNLWQTSLSQLTPSMRFDILFGLYKSKRSGSIRFLQQVLQDIDTIFEFLQLGQIMKLHLMFEDIQEQVIHTEENLSQTIASAFARHTQRNTVTISLHTGGNNLASFLVQGGYYMAAETVLIATKNVDEVLLQQTDELASYNHCQRLLLETMTKLLHCYSEYRHFELADEIFSNILKKFKNTDCIENLNSLSSVYNECSNYCYNKSQYREAYEWGLKAVLNLTNEVPSRIQIDCLRQAGKASVLRREFPKAEILLKEALLRARDVYGETHLKYADCLVDYAFYLLNVDGVTKSVQAYEKALSVREKILGSSNLLVARAYEELAYATYVQEYNSGHFETARMYADTALQIMKKIIPANHLLMASSQRVLALILEEIAIDVNDKKLGSEMLHQAEELHLSAVSLSSSAFGEMNVQTAKHYGNLGRLYQTMEKFHQAEQMHLKAIHIKENLLGKDDYEVALSIGHLASLYNYDLEELNKAEELYLRSIAISLRLFGPAYSGLEYDYRGLVRVYELSSDWNNVYQYLYKLRDWKELRRAKETENNNEDFKEFRARPLTKIVQSISSMTSNSFNAGDSTEVDPMDST